MTLDIVNSTANFSLNKKLCLTKTRLFSDEILETKSTKSNKFSSLKWRLRNFHVTALIYESGRIVLVGGKDISLVLDSASYLFDLFGGQGDLVTQLSNIVASFKFLTLINLPILWEKIHLNCEPHKRVLAQWEPELFHGLIFKMPDTKATAIIFSTGRVNITGCNSLEKAVLSYESLSDLLNSYLN